MRSAFVLIALFIGLACGYSIPIGKTKFSEKIADMTNDDKQIVENVTQTESRRINELPNNRTEIDEKALYENAEAKQNDQSTRAFIYINQKYKKPSLHQYFRLAQNGPEYSRSLHLPPPIPQASIQRLNEPCKSEAYVNSYFDGYDFPNISPDLASYFVRQPLNKCNCNSMVSGTNYKGNTYKDNERLSKINTISSQKRDYIELLKSPLLRPLKRENLDTKYDGIPGPHLSSLNYTDNPKLHNLRKKYNPKDKILVDERKSEKRFNYGFNPPFTHYAADKEPTQVEERNFEGDFTNDDDFAQPFEKAQEEDKLLDQYLRDTLEDQVISKENPIISNDCSYRECILQHAKTSSSTGSRKPFKNPDCKCGHRLKLQQNEAHGRRNTLKPTKIKNKHNGTNVAKRPTDVSYYEQILKPRTNGFKISPINSTYYH